MEKNLLSIESNVKDKCPTLELGYIQCKVKIKDEMAKFLKAFGFWIFLIKKVDEKQVSSI